MRHGTRVTNLHTKYFKGLTTSLRMAASLWGDKRENCGSLPSCLGHTAKREATLGSCGAAQKTKLMGGVMKLKLVVSLLAVLSLFGTTARAQETAPKVDIFAGYSYLQSNPGVSGVDSFHLHGGSASIAYNYKTWLSGVADFGGYNNGNVLGTGGRGTLPNHPFGPRVAYRHLPQVPPFGPGLFGVPHADSTAFWDTQ